MGEIQKTSVENCLLKSLGINRQNITDSLLMQVVHENFANFVKMTTMSKFKSLTNPTLFYSAEELSYIHGAENYCSGDLVQKVLDKTFVNKFLTYGITFENSFQCKPQNVK